jgi:cell division protein ZapB
MINDDLDQNSLPDPLAELDPASEIALIHLITLGQRVDQVLALCERLTQENQALRGQHDALAAERDALRDKYEHSRARIEAMIVRLKGLEQSS